MKIYLYGAGNAGILVYGILKICGIKVDGFVDNSLEKRNSVILENLKSKIPEDICDKDKCIVFICIRWREYIDLYNNAIFNGFRRICEFSDLIDDILENQTNYLEDVLEFLGKYNCGIDIFFQSGFGRNATKLGDANQVRMKGRIAVYTASFGDYDEINLPRLFPPNVDYYYVSDTKPNMTEGIKWIDGKCCIPSGIESPILRNRYAKMHPIELFPDYDYTIYLDSNLEVIDDVSTFIRDSKTGISAHNHHNRDCIYYEAMQVVNFKRITWRDGYEQMIKYLSCGFPIHYGLSEMPVIAIDHTKSDSDIILKKWWDEFMKGALRDQLSFMYVLWTLGFSAKDIASIGAEYRENPKFIYHEHLDETKMISNVAKEVYKKDNSRMV